MTTDETHVHLHDDSTPVPGQPDPQLIMQIMKREFDNYISSATDNRIYLISVIETQRQEIEALKQEVTSLTPAVAGKPPAKK